VVPCLSTKGLLDVVFPVVLKQFGMLIGLDVQGDHFGESRAANSIPWRVMLLQRSMAMTAMGC
jgi:hypothetical protein